MSQVTVTTTTTTAAVTVCSRVIFKTMMVMLSSNSLGKTMSGQHDVVWPLQLILKDTVRGSVGLTTMLQQQQSQSQIPSQAYANYAMGHPLVSFSFRVEHPTNSLCHLLVSVMVFTFSFQVPIWFLCSPVGAQPLGFASP